VREQHAILAQRDDEVLGLVALVDAGADLGGGERLVRLGFESGELEGLLAVGRDEIGLVKVEFAARLGVDGDELLVLAGKAGDARDEGVAEQALGVVGEDDGVRGLDRFFEERAQLRLVDVVIVLRGFAVEAADLLAADDDAGLDDGRAAAGRGDGLDAALGQDALEAFAGVVAALPKKPAMLALAPSEAMLRATLAAPPAL
jgi:hypothetical protein